MVQAIAAGRSPTTIKRMPMLRKNALKGRGHRGRGGIRGMTMTIDGAIMMMNRGRVMTSSTIRREVSAMKISRNEATEPSKFLNQRAMEGPSGKSLKMKVRLIGLKTTSRRPHQVSTRPVKPLYRPTTSTTSQSTAAAIAESMIRVALFNVKVRTATNGSATARATR